MTSEGPHHPGQEPDEVSPGAGGPAPYGDRPAQQDNGYDAAAPRPGLGTPTAGAAQHRRRRPGRPAEQPPPPPGVPPQPPQHSDPAQPAWAAGGGASEPPPAAARPLARRRPAHRPPRSPPPGWRSSRPGAGRAERTRTRPGAPERRPSSRLGAGPARPRRGAAQCRPASSRLARPGRPGPRPAAGVGGTGPPARR